MFDLWKENFPRSETVFKVYYPEWSVHTKFSFIFPDKDEEEGQWGSSKSRVGRQCIWLIHVTIIVFLTLISLLSSSD